MLGPGSDGSAGLVRSHKGATTQSKATLTHLLAGHLSNNEIFATIKDRKAHLSFVGFWIYQKTKLNASTCLCKSKLTALLFGEDGSASCRLSSDSGTSHPTHVASLLGMHDFIQGKYY